MNKLKLFLIFNIIIFVISIISAGDSFLFLNNTGDIVTEINSSGGISGVGNMTFIDEDNGYSFFRILGDINNLVEETWITTLNVVGNWTNDGTIVGRDFPSSVLLSCNFDDSYTCDGGESGTLEYNIEGLWHFETGTGTKAFDESDSAYHGVFNNGPVWTASGRFGGGIEFDGVDDFLDTNAPALGSVSGISIGGWAYMKGANRGTADNDTMVLMGNANTGFIIKNGFKIGCRGYSEGTPTCSFRLGGAGGTSGEALVPIDEWFHVVGVSNLTDIMIYINGELGSSITDDNIPISVFDFLIGAGEGGIFDGIWGRWNGTIDEAFFINEILLEDEILFLSQNRWTETAFLDSNKGDFDRGYYPFEDNCLSYPTAGNINKDQGTVSMWVKPSWDGDDDTTYYFMDLDKTFGRIQFGKTASNDLFFCIQDASGLCRAMRFPVNVTNMPKNTWHHIAATWDKEPTGLYLNGVLVNDTNDGAGIGVATQLPDLIRIGCNWNTNDLFSKSIIDEFQIRNRPLTPSEVRELYEVGNINKSVTGNTPHWENNIFSAYTNADSATFTIVPIKLVWDVVNRQNSLYGINNTVINIKKTGMYMLNFDCSLDVQTGTARSVGRCYLEINDVLIDGTLCFDYVRTAGNGDQTCSVNRIIALEKGDFIRAEAARHTGTDTLQAMADGSRINLEFLG